eukprot:c43327_g1_i1 orf=207-767(+)
MSRKRTRKISLDSCQIGGKILEPGDCVILKSSDPNVASYVARIERIDGTEDATTLYVRWYYRPEESAGGRRQFHGSKELFLSDHYDTCSPEAVESKCTVHSFKDYTRLDHVGEEDFYCRFEYKAASGTFIPDRVAVYCTCEMPYNPDELMVQCEKCRDWFHPSCVHKTPEEIRQLYHFFCPGCSTF